MDPLTIILTNAAITAYNTWQNSRNNSKLQAKQQEFAKAVAARNDTLMWNLLRESQEISMQMERDLHDQRIEDLKNDFDQLLEKTAKQVSINTWPLKVLPIVMKNQSLGNIIVKKDENIAMHCILTPSNSASFNQMILPVLDRQLEDYFNRYWSPMSNHPVLFYGGAWSSKCCPTGTEIKQLKSHLQNLPTLIVTPYFKENESGLVFKLNGWGMGYEIKENEIMPTGFSYRGDTYSKDSDFVMNDELRNTTIEDFTPYLQCLIAYFADQYFWNGYGVTPQLLFHLKSKVISTDGQPYLLKEYESTYHNFIDNYLSSEDNVLYLPDKCIRLCSASVAFQDKVAQIIRKYCSAYDKTFYNNPTDFVKKNHFHREEFAILDALMPYVDDKAVIKQKKEEFWERFHRIVPKFEFKSVPVLTYSDMLCFAKENRSFFPDADSFEILFEDKEFSVVCFFSRKGHVEHNDKIGVMVYLTPVSYLPKSLSKEEHIVVKLLELDYIINETEKDMNALEISLLLNGSNNNEGQHVVDRFEAEKSKFNAEMEKKFLEKKAKEENMMEKVKDSVNTAFSSISDSVTGTMDEAKEKFSPMFEDVKGKLGSLFNKKK